MKKNVLLTLGMTSTLVGMSTLNVHANERVEVSVSTLNVRSGPSTSHSVIDKIHKGDVVEVIDKSNGWIKIRLSNGKTGWSSADYLKSVSEGNDESTGKYKTVTTSALNVRSGPSTGYSVITKVHKGDKVEILDTKNGWDKIKLSNGKTGWSSNQYLGTSSSSGNDNNESTGKYKTVTTSTLNIRSGPSTSYSVITKVHKGDKVEILDTKNGWDKIKLSNGKTGWASNAYLGTISSGGNDNNESTGKYKTVTTSALNVRSGPSTSYSVTSKVYKGDKVEILDTKSGWDKIKTSNGKTGWASNQYLGSSSNENGSTNPGDNSSEAKKREAVVDLAHAQLGKPYVWGAEGPGSFDCSGLTSYVYKNAANINLPRTSKEQSLYGKKISRDELQPGDLIFASTNGTGQVSHVGIYIGNDYMIHSPKPGEVVKKAKIDIPYWEDVYLWSRDVF